MISHLHKIILPSVLTRLETIISATPSLVTPKRKSDALLLHIRARLTRALTSRISAPRSLQKLVASFAEVSSSDLKSQERKPDPAKPYWDVG